MKKYPGSCSQTCMERLVPRPITAVPDVMNICLPSGQSINGTLLERKLKSSCFGRITQEVRPIARNFVLSCRSPSYPFSSLIPY